MGFAPMKMDMGSTGARLDVARGCSMHALGRSEAATASSNLTRRVGSLPIHSFTTVGRQCSQQVLPPLRFVLAGAWDGAPEEEASGVQEGHMAVQVPLVMSAGSIWTEAIFLSICDANLGGHNTMTHMSLAVIVRQRNNCIR